MIRRALARSGLLLALLPLPAQAQQQAPVLTETLEVTIANVEVVVTDDAGKRVVGLGRDAFQIFENGVRKEISNFAEFRESVAPAPSVAPPVEGVAAAPASGEIEDLPPRRIVVFVDMLTTDMFHRKRVLASLDPLLDELAAGDEIMVVSWNGSLDIAVEPTANRDAAREGLARLAKHASLSRAAKLRMDQGTSGNWRKQAVQMAATDLRRSVYALRGVLTRLAPVGGRKALILISEGFEMQPGRELLTVENPFDLDVPAMIEPGADGSRGMRTDTPLFEMESGDGPDLVKSVVKAANAAGVTLYTIHGGGLASHGSVEHISAPMEIFMPRVDRPNEPVPDINRPVSTDLADIARDRVVNSLEGLTHLAARSGGLVAKNTNDFRAAFGEIAADLSSYYSLGYRVASGEVGDRRIEVRMRDPRLTARARQSITVRSADEEIADALVANLAFPRASNDLAISAILAGAERANRKQLTIPVDVRIPLETLSFIQSGESFVANLSIFIGAADAGNTTTEVRRFDQPVVIAKDDIEKIGGQHYTYRLTVDLRSRTAENKVSIAVIDNVSRLTGFAVAAIEKNDVKRK
jgi:VWFA-related protein